MANPFRAVLRKFMTDASLFGQALPDSWIPAMTPETGITGIYLSDPTQSDLVRGIIRLLGDAVGSTGFVIQEMRGNDEVLHTSHMATDILHRPSGNMTWRELSLSIADGLIGCGNVYLLPVTSSELRLLDWRHMRGPRRGQMWYEYRDPWSGSIMRYGLDDLVHLRYQRAPDGVNGQGPLNAAVLEEIQTDVLARRYTSTLLRKMGVINFAITPADEKESISQEHASAMERALGSRFTGRNRGGVAVFAKRLQFHEFQGVMQRVDMRQIRWVPEERVYMACGVPPALVSIGTGSEQTRVGATLEYLTNHYWVNTVQPLLNTIAEQLTVQLLPYYVRDTRRFRFAPNLEHAPVLARLRAEAHKRQLEAAVQGYHSGLLGFAEARAIAGFDADKPMDVLPLPFGGPSIVVQAEGTAKSADADLPALQKGVTMPVEERG